MTTINTNSPNRSYTITGLTNDVTYKVRVAAVNSIGTGPFTEYIYATPSFFAIDDDFYNVELLLSMDQIIDSDPYYGNTSFILGSSSLGPNDDPYSLQTALLLHGDGIAIIDSSLSNKAVSINGGVQTVSDSRFGTGSLSFNGSNYLTFGSSNDFSVGTGDFTVEFFVKFNSINTHNPLCNTTTDPNSADNGKWYINYNTTTGLYFGRHGTADSVAVPWLASTNTWYHLAIVRQSGIMRIFIDGIEQNVTNATIFNNISFNQSGFSVGKVASLSGFNGQIDEFRFTKGVARNVVLPSAAYPNPSNPFRDVSPNSKTIFSINQPSLDFYSSLQAPTNIVPSQPQAGSLTLNWTAPTAPPGVSDYIIQYSTDGGVLWTTVNDGVSSSNSVTINNLANGSYIFRVAGTNGDLQSPWSSIDINMPLQGESVQYLVVAGGGGGGSNMGGGGGAGGLRTSRVGSISGGGASAEPLLFLAANTVYPITVGAGGSGAPAGINQANGTSGNNSSIAAITTVGGGGGASQYSENGGRAGTSGGSGGGGNSLNASGGAGTLNQGFSGGSGGNNYYMGGGGGAGAVGAGTVGHTSQAHGGNGVVNNINGTSLYWAGGGGGSGYNTTGGNGGLGGGGGGAIGTTTGGSGLNSGSAGGGGNTTSQANTPGGNAGANTGGGGGGGAHYNSNNYGGSGGSGIVIIRSSNANAVTEGSPTITTDGSDTVYTFTGAGSIIFPENSAPSAPQNITATSNNPGDTTISWDAINGATDYVVQYSTNNGTSWTTVNDGVSSNNNVTISGLADGNYYFRVAAVNSNGQGGWRAKSVTLPLPPPSTAEYLVVAGGGGGGASHGGGGGAGGYLSGTITPLSGTSYTITVGAGGSGGPSINFAGNSGNNSSAFNTTSVGGGGGGGRTTGGTGAAIIGKNGGSGGGGAGTTPTTAGTGTSGQGNEGGAGSSDSTAGNGGGGGGASAAGGAASGVDTTGTSGSGGNGTQWLDGKYYAGGGAGGRWGNGTVGVAGLGGGGAGGSGNDTGGSNATANTGGGGGGGSSGLNPSGGSGGSGIVIIKSTITATSTIGSPIVSPASDPYFKDVALLLHMNDNAATFTDVSPNPKTITPLGSATQSSTQSKWGGKSVALLNNGSYLRINSIPNIGTKDFTLESWVFIAGVQSDNSALFDFRYPGVTGFNVEIDQSRRLSVNLPSNGRQWVSTLPLSQWVYIAISRTSGTIRTYVDGTLVDSTTDNNNYNLASLPYGFIGANFDFTSYGWSSPNYYVDDVRFTIGSGRNYTGSSISIPDSQFPDSNSTGDKLYIFTGTGSITF